MGNQGAAQASRRQRRAKQGYHAGIGADPLVHFSFTYLRSVRNGQFDQTPENATRYEVTWSNGETSFYYAYDDPLPLYVQDLTKTDYDRYSCELAEESSPLASQVRGAQRMRTGDEDDAPELNYEVTDVKFAPLFDACLDGELKYFQNYTVTFTARIAPSGTGNTARWTPHRGARTARGRPSIPKATAGASRGS